MKRLIPIALLLVALTACGPRNRSAWPEPFGPGDTAIEFENQSQQRISITFNGTYVGDLEAGQMQRFTLPFGVYAVAVDPFGRGDPVIFDIDVTNVDSGRTNTFSFIRLTALEPFQYVGLMPGQTTIMVYR